MPERTFPFVNKGLILRVDSGDLPAGAFVENLNIDSTKEGSVCPRAGTKRFTGNNGGVWLTPHSLSKMKIGGPDASDPRYVGEQNNIWRVTGPYSTDVNVSTGLLLSEVNLARWEAQPYNSGDSGTPYMYFAHPARNLRDDSTFTPLRRWGIPPPTIPVSLALGGSVSNGPNGDYTYLYTIRNPLTGEEGNPCALPAASNTISPSNESVVVTYWGAQKDNVADPTNGDPALAGLGSIAIYRAGGRFGDGLYRFVGYGTNPGYSAGLPLSGTFTDTKDDTSLDGARTIEFDNDMPVTSNLPVPFVGSIASVDLVSAAPFARVYLTNYQTLGQGSNLNLEATYFTPYSQVTVGTADNQEVCIVFNVGTTLAASANYITVFLQNTHSTGEQVECDANAGRPCDLITLYQDAILLAGDTRNPHVLYRSKSGRPQAFPVIDLEDGNAHQVNVGSPSDPIMGITEFDGEVVCLNQKSINVFIVLNGAISSPQRSPSDRGMVAKHCWCRVNNEIWFLSYDGIYSWSGGAAILRSEAIRSIFNSYSTVIADQTYFQIDYTELDAFHIECFDEEVWMVYIDVNGGYNALRYQLLYDRWLPVQITGSTVNGAVFGALYMERDTGRFISGVQINNPDFPITATSNGSPDIITAIGNTLVNGQSITIVGATGDTAINGAFLQVTNVGVAGPGTFELVGINGNGTYLGGGVVKSGIGYLEQIGIGTSDSWSVNENDGTPIQWSFQTGYQSVEEKTRLNQMYELVVEISNPLMGPGDFININMLYDYSSTLDVVDAFVVTSPGIRRFLTFPLQKSSFTGTAEGKEARCAGLFAFGHTVNHVEIYSWTIRYNPLQIPTRNSILDWQNLGTNNDKQLYVIDLEYDPKGQFVVMDVDIIAGVFGQIVPSVQQIFLVPAIFSTITLPMNPGTPTVSIGAGPANVGNVLQIGSELLLVTANPGLTPNVQRGYLGTVTGTYTSGTPIYSVGRIKQTFPIVDNVICKAVRLRPVTPSLDYEIFSWAFDPKEDYPPDIVYFSPLTDNGSPFEKFFNQIILDVDTNDLDVVVNLELDGTVAFNFTVNTNRFTRHVNITCPPLLSGTQARILPRQPFPQGAKFQLWSVQYATQPADEGVVVHTTDWDNLGTQNDKQLVNISFEYDGSAGDVEMGVDEMSGINGGVITTNAIRFLLLSNARASQSFAFPDGHIVKALRVHPTTLDPVPVDYKGWKYVCTKIDYPADYILFTDLVDNGMPYIKYVNQIVIEVDTNGKDVVAHLELDGAQVFAFTVNATRLDRRRAYTCPANLVGVNMRLVIESPLVAGAKFQMWSVQYVTEKADRGPVTHSYDWDDLGSRDDKQLRTIKFEYDGSAGDIIIAIDEMVGLGGGTIIPSAITFALSASTRAVQQFAFPDGHVVKQLRVYPASTPIVPLNFKSWKYSCEFIQFPPDVVLFTDLTDNSSPYEKYVNQVVLEVDTNNLPVQVNVELDGVVKFSFVVISTRLTRRQSFVCPSQISGTNMRIVIPNILVPPTKFQLWGVVFITEPADKAAVTHSYDWDDLGWPYDKKLHSLTIEYDGSAGDITMRMELLGGINGIVRLPNMTFPLIGPSRSKQQFGIPDGIIVKMVRLSPLDNPNVNFKSWRYRIEKVDYPADFVLFTEKKDFGYPCEKIARNLELDIDTGGVPAQVAVLADGVTMQTFTVDTTSTDRSRIIAFTSNLIGREWNLELTPGIGGKTQLFNWSIDVIREPCAITFFDTYEQRFGYDGFKWVKEAWIAYSCPSPITVTVFTDYDQTFFKFVLPAHPNRDMERIYFPAIDNTNTVLNKSKSYRLQVRVATQAEIDDAVPYTYLHLTNYEQGQVS